MKSWDVPMYSSAMAGKLVGLTPTRVRRWLQGYRYIYISGQNHALCTGHKDPIIYRSDVADLNFASFLDLIDLLFVKQFLDRGVSLQRTRKALSEAESIIGGHHFAQRTFFTNGHNIFIQVKEHGDAILELLTGGQWVIAPIIKELSQKIDFDRSSGFAQRWYPWGKNASIVVDPSVSFGRPTIVGRGIATANIYDLFTAENEGLKNVCSWFNLREDEVDNAVKFERYLLAA